MVDAAALAWAGERGETGRKERGRGRKLSCRGFVAGASDSCQRGSGSGWLVVVNGWMFGDH